MRVSLVVALLFFTACKSRQPAADTFSTSTQQSYMMNVSKMNLVSSEYENGTSVSAGIGYLFCNPDRQTECTGNSNHWFLNTYELGSDFPGAGRVQFVAPVMPFAPAYQVQPFDGLRSHLVMDAWFKAGTFHNTRKARFSADVDLSNVDSAPAGKLVVDFSLEGENETWNGSTLQLTFAKRP